MGFEPMTSVLPLRCQRVQLLASSMLGFVMHVVFIYNIFFYTRLHELLALNTNRV